MAFDSSFDLTKAPIRNAVWIEDFFSLKFLSPIRKVSYWILWGMGAGFLFVFFLEPAKQDLQRILLGITLLFFSYTSLIFLLERFAISLRNTRPQPLDPNIAVFLSFGAAHALTHATTFAARKKFPELTPTILLYILLQEHKELRFVFDRALLDQKALLKSLKETISKKPAPVVTRERSGLRYAKDLKVVLAESRVTAKTSNHERIRIGDLLVSLAIHEPHFKRVLILNDLTEKDIYNLVLWQEKKDEEMAVAKKFWLKKNLRKLGNLGKNWAAGYTITLDMFSDDLSEAVRLSNFPKAIGHDAQKEALERILSRQRNNVLLIGEPGSGRERLIWDFVSKSVLGEHRNQNLNYTRVVRVDIPFLLSSLKSTEEVESVLDQMFQEIVQAGNVILVLEDFHNFIGEGKQEEAAARMNIAAILMSYLRSPQFPMIAVTTYTGLHRYIEHNPSLLILFEKIEVSQISQDQTLGVLTEIVPKLEHRYGHFISYPALKAAINFSIKYIQAIPLPKKAIDTLEEASILLAGTEGNVLLPHHIAQLISEKTGIPVGEAEAGEREVLLNLEDLIHQRIINQEEAVKEVASSLRRARAEVSSKKGPMGSFLFLGPTGVGKTETAKALAAIYFGSESRMIRLDMSEFQHVDDISRLLGTEYREGLLTTAVREDPFSLLLLDELEKAHPSVLNLFLQVLDEGHITDGLGRKVDFRHVIIIATSNAGYRLILQAIRENKNFSALKQEMLDHLFQKGIFRPEFLNRFDAVVLFKPLSKENLLDIAELMFNTLKKNLDAKGIELIISEPLKEKIVELGYKPIFGARNMRRVIQDKVENVLAQALLARTIRRGDKVSIEPKDFEITKLQ
ncbi:ATP-dependent Clp protease ATP-binding subunit [Patescibacteria group bacterium]|nr:ATP-dependent Clp protease ATP-binding subunit [Patescibacteria group bacterium]